MTQPTILVTGATGNTGGAIVSELLRKGVPVRAMVRRRDARSSALEARGAEVVVADLFDPDQLVAAMRGAQRAYFVPPYTPYAIQSAVAFAVAAREAKLESIVQMSQWTSHRNHPALMTRQTWLIDRMFAELRSSRTPFSTPAYSPTISCARSIQRRCSAFSHCSPATAKRRRSPTRTSRGLRSPR
jgi:NAD(P)H dehydrogenase (quinone)